MWFESHCTYRQGADAARLHNQYVEGVTEGSWCPGNNNDYQAMTAYIQVIVKLHVLKCFTVWNDLNLHIFLILNNGVENNIHIDADCLLHFAL